MHFALAHKHTVQIQKATERKVHTEQTQHPRHCHGGGGHQREPHRRGKECLKQFQTIILSGHSFPTHLNDTPQSQSSFKSWKKGRNNIQQLCLKNVIPE